ncbi:MAG: hypothetical protein HY834_04435 [Devosia nanyangense]|uniref:Uncharacterized protein n=1 Tax=Devosia nanyangense TaxID=1228055 RepID=A0A933L0K8_9HYPH|nr:hypothetical protein [Devosia nanyangense]
MLVRYRPRAWHLVIVALIAAFDLVVLYMVLNPRVADDYRAYYIDRSASCFPRIASGYYPLGAPVSFVTGRNGYQRDTIRWCGFMAAKTDGIKSFGDYGILKLKFPVPDNDLLLTFSSWVNSSADKPPRDVQVVVNGERLETITYTTARRVNGRFVIPAWLAKRGDGGLEIKFEVPRIGPPGTNSEPVTLQLRLEALRVSVLAENKAVERPSPAKLR